MDALAAQIRFLDDILYNEIIDINSIFWHACLAIISRMVMSTETLVHRKDFVAGRKDYFLCLISFVVIALNYLGERMLFGFLKASRVGSQTFYAFIERLPFFWWYVNRLLEWLLSLSSPYTSFSCVIEVRTKTQTFWPSWMNWKRTRTELKVPKSRRQCEVHFLISSSKLDLSRAALEPTSEDRDDFCNLPLTLN